MASGKYVKAVSGVLSFGYNTTQYAAAKAATISSGGKTYYGYKDSSCQYLGITASDIYLGKYKGYTGTVKAYTSFYSPYGVLIYSPKDLSTSRVSMHYYYMTFKCGILTSYSYGG